MIITIDTEERLNSIKEINKKKSEEALTKLLDIVKTDQAKELLGLPIDKTSIKDLQGKAAILQENILFPSADKNYKPIEVK